MSKRNWEELVMVFKKKGLTGIMESQAGNSKRKCVYVPNVFKVTKKGACASQSQSQKMKEKRPVEVSIA